MLYLHYSQTSDSHKGPIPAPTPVPVPKLACDWKNNTAQSGKDLHNAVGAATKEECCALCWANPHCAAADFNHASTGQKTPSLRTFCHLKGANLPKQRKDGSVSCLPTRSTNRSSQWLMHEQSVHGTVAPALLSDGGKLGSPLRMALTEVHHNLYYSYARIDLKAPKFTPFMGSNWSRFSSIVSDTNSKYGNGSLLVRLSFGN